MAADAVEALAGAIFLDGGYAAVRRFVLAHFPFDAAGAGVRLDPDPKSRLQEWCQARGHPLPRYRLVAQAGPPHARRFTVVCRAAHGLEGSGCASTKKEAEMEAARAVLAAIAEPGAP